MAKRALSHRVEGGSAADEADEIGLIEVSAVPAALDDAELRRPVRRLEDRPLMSFHGGDAVLRRGHQQHRNLDHRGGLHRAGPGVCGAQRGHGADARVHGCRQHGGAAAHGVAADRPRGHIDRHAIPVVGHSGQGHSIERGHEIGAERLMAGHQPGTGAWGDDRDAPRRQMLERRLVGLDGGQVAVAEGVDR